MPTKIITKNGSGVPSAASLEKGELAIDLTNSRLYTENAAGTVIELGVAPTSVTTGTLTATSATVNGNITVTGTVDGRDVSVDGAKLDGIEAGATADQTASEILAALITVDGAGSGLDADLLDGQSGAYYLDYNNFTNKPTLFSGTFTDGSRTAPSITFTSDTDTGFFRGGADFCGVSTGGVNRMQWVGADTYVTSTTQASGVPLSTESYIKLESDGLDGITTNSINYPLFVLNNGSTAGFIQMSGSSVSYNTSSDYRLKENVTAITCGLDEVLAMSPKSYNFIGYPELHHGFLAHELQAVCPQAVTGTKDAVDANGNPVYQGVDAAKIVPVLVKAIQELTARLEALENPAP